MERGHAPESDLAIAVLRNRIRAVVMVTSTVECSSDSTAMAAEVGVAHSTVVVERSASVDVDVVVGRAGHSGGGKSRR